MRVQQVDPVGAISPFIPLAVCHHIVVPFLNDVLEGEWRGSDHRLLQAHIFVDPINDIFLTGDPYRAVVVFRHQYCVVVLQFPGIGLIYGIVYENIPVWKEATDPSAGGDPEPSLLIAMKGLCLVGNQRTAVFVAMKILFHAIAVPAIEAIVGTYPYKALFVFRHAGGAIAAETIGRGDMVELRIRKGLGRCTCTCEQDC